MSKYTGQVCVVTGAASGMGRSMATRLVEQGALLAVCDVNSPGLAETVQMCKEAGGRVLAKVVDISDRDAVDAFAHDVVDEFGVVNFVFNNAGIAVGGTVLKWDHEDYERILAINVFGTINSTKAFLPHLIESGDGHIANTASVNGLFALPYLSGYCTSKFAVRGFTEALRMEMLMAKHPVTVTSVLPGGIRTPVARNAFERDADATREIRKIIEAAQPTSADSAARIILKGVEKGKKTVLVGFDAHMINAIIKMSGPRYQRPIALLFRFVVPKSARNL